MTSIDVRCEHISKRYLVRRRQTSTSPRFLGGLFERRGPEQEFWALRDLSFELPRGETLGVVGRNGAGKSTLLKLLGGITAPTEGQITIVGRLSAMIEVGSGFHPELTGRENVFLSGAILGMRRRDIASRLDSIADFSGVAAFLDTPVKFYSSGMYVRLGFAIAAHLEPEILLVDEVLAVGDAEFQARCMQRIEALKRRGTTMMLVSHDLGAIEQLSDRAVLIEGGRLTAAGTAHDVVTTYQRLVHAPDALPVDAVSELPDGPPALHIERLTLHDADARPLLSAFAGAPLIARVALTFATATAAVIRLSIYEFEQGTLLTELLAEVDGAAGEIEVQFAMPQLLLAPGTYTLGVTATPAGAARPSAWHFGRTTLYVQGGTARKGVFEQPFESHVSMASPAVAGSAGEPS
jgi:ABC-type polysaccharide/polyol phosphate transport system ATPase subunit